MTESMQDFFAARVDTYDAHMLQNVEGCAEAYGEVVRLLPEKTASLLDLRCGTGLELEQVWARFPGLWVTGIDLTKAMLDRLVQKYPGKNLTLVCGNYLQVNFGTACFDAAISFETMHHLLPEEKLAVYKKMLAALKAGGCYIECDYMAGTQEEETECLAEYQRQAQAANIAPGTPVHIDIPFTVEHQLELFRQTGFACVRAIWRKRNTAVLVATKR